MKTKLNWRRSLKISGSFNYFHHMSLASLNSLSLLHFSYVVQMAEFAVTEVWVQRSSSNYYMLDKLNANF